MNLLSAATVQLISSSQVITSPISAVKELIENSLDAGCSQIDIKLENYGFNRIEIRDNGCGVDADNVSFMARPHYTSKITQTDDLNDLHTYGFRGEALGSLCGVAKVTTTTKTDQDDSATTYDFDGFGNIVSKKPSSNGTGTTIVVLNLFENLPVRRQYYNTVKKQKEELKNVEELVIAYSIACYDVGFSLRHNKDHIWQKNSVSSFRDALIKVLGSSVMNEMQHIQTDRNEEPTIKTSIFLPKLTSDFSLMSSSNSNKSYIFVNQRVVKVKEIEKLIKEFYCKAFGCSNRYPHGLINISVPADMVDVNIDPNKTRLMFKKELELMPFLENIFTQLYGQKSMNIEKSDTTSCSRNKTSSNISKLTQDCDLQISSHFSKDDTNNEQLNPNSNLNFDLNHDLFDGESNYFTPTNDSLSSDVTTPVFKSEKSLNNDEIFSPRNESLLSMCDIPDVTTPVFKSKKTINNDEIFTPRNDSLLLMCDTSGIETPVSTSKESLDDSVPLMSDIPDISTPDNLFTPKSDDLLLMCDNPVKCQKSLSYDSQSENLEERTFELDSIQGKDTDVTLRARSANDEFDDLMKWSMGLSFSDDGNSINPVDVLMENRDTIGVNADSKSKMKNSTDTPLQLKHFTQITQPTLFDLACKSPGEKMVSGFVLFAREERKKLLKDSPDMDFELIAKTVAVKWQSLSNEEKKSYGNENDTAGDESEIFPSKVVKKVTSIQSAVSTKEPQVKRQKLQKSPSLLQVISKSPKVKVQNNKEISLHMKFLKEAFLKYTIKRKKENSQDAFTLIGQLNSSDVWIVRIENKAYTFHPQRLQEMIIYDRLLSKHCLVTEILNDAVRITKKVVSHGNVYVLHSLSRSDLTGVNIFSYITDDRIVKNGFKIKCLEGLNSDDVSFEITGITSLISDYDIQDLTTILDSIKSDTNVEVNGCRPSKVKGFLQKEAERMSKEIPLNNSHYQVVDIIKEYLKVSPLTKCNMCFHEKEIFFCIYDLSEIL